MSSQLTSFTYTLRSWITNLVSPNRREVSAWPSLPLDELDQHVRILDIHPHRSWFRTKGQVRSISCTSTVHRLEEAPAFTALSYCWGEEPATNEIICNGQVLKIKPNLHAALLQLRKKGYRRVWIDAICIKQDDHEEKNHQVNLMSEIYQAATDTIIWLGSSQPDPELVVKYIQDLSTAYTMNQSYVETQFGSTWWFTVDDLAPLGLPSWELSTIDRRLKPLAELYTSGWWRRTWVLQEFALSQNPIFMHGNTLFNAADLDSALRVLWRIYAFHSYGGDALQHAENMFYLRCECTNNCGDLASVALMTRSTHCGDEHDRIYSLLGLLRNVARRQQLHLNIRPDYGRSISATYTQAAREILSLSSNLDLLTCVQLPGSKKPNVPSWVPFFRTQTMCDELRAIIYDHGYRASRDSEASPTFQDNALCLRGYVFDQIVASSSSVEDPTAPVQVLKDQRSLGTWKAFSFWEVFYMQPVTVNRIVSAEAALRALYRKHKLMQSRNMPPHVGNTFDPFHQATTDFSKFGTIQESRRIAKTQRDFYCNVPHESRVGDKIALCAGGRTPFVVRAFDALDGTRYRILGGCYVAEIMYGEEWKPELAEDMWFD